MKTNISLEERMAVVEAAITQIQAQIADPPLNNWLEQISGSFKDEPAFDEILAYGKAIRQGEGEKIFAPTAD